jgi:hypothetical protein
MPQVSGSLSTNFIALGLGVDSISAILGMGVSRRGLQREKLSV